MVEQKWPGSSNWYKHFICYRIVGFVNGWDLRLLSKLQTIRCNSLSFLMQSGKICLSRTSFMFLLMSAYFQEFVSSWIFNSWTNVLSTK